MHISKKLGIGAAVGALLGYAFVWKYVNLFGAAKGRTIPTYGAEVMEAHLSTLLILAAVAFVFLPNLKTLTTPKHRKIALILGGLAVAFQIVPMADFSKMAVDAGLGFYIQVVGAVLALAAAVMAKSAASTEA
ncbi:MAG: hypothetical protein QNJ98_17810 [Planctomycetota bacterium]|nr:hypothetical protein [Planctomycetota bacterium]